MSDYGMMKPGTVGRLGKDGRLVYVEKVTRYVAYLISLPEQDDIEADMDRRFLGPSKQICTSPFVEFYTVDVRSLSEVNLEFLETLLDPSKPKPVPQVTPKPVPPIAPRQPEMRLEAVKREGLGKTTGVIFDTIKKLGTPALPDVVKECGIKATPAVIEWHVANLVRLGHLKWKQV